MGSTVALQLQVSTNPLAPGRLKGGETILQVSTNPLAPGSKGGETILQVSTNRLGPGRLKGG